MPLNVTIHVIGLNDMFRAPASVLCCAFACVLAIVQTATAQVDIELRSESARTTIRAFTAGVPSTTINLDDGVVRSLQAAQEGHVFHPDCKPLTFECSRAPFPVDPSPPESCNQPVASSADTCWMSESNHNPVRRAARTPEPVIAILVAATLFGACGKSPGNEAAVMLDPARIPHQQSDERTPRTVRAVWSDTLDIIEGVAPIVQLLPDTTILVGDNKLQTISVYDRHGALIRRHGSPGGGPGEFERLAAAVPLADGRIIGVDASSRASVFSRDGQVVMSTSLVAATGTVAPFRDGFITANVLQTPFYRAYDANLKPTISFGEPLFPIEQGLLGVGWIVDGSSNDERRVIHVAQFAGYMVAHDDRGQPLYSIRTVAPPRLELLRMDGRSLDSKSVTTTVLPISTDGEYMYVMSFSDNTEGWPVDVYDVADGTYQYTIANESTSCGHRFIRGDLAVLACLDGLVLLQKFRLDETR